MSDHFPCEIVRWKDIPEAVSKDDSHQYVIVVQYGDRYRVTWTHDIEQSLDGLLTGCPNRDMWLADYHHVAYAPQVSNYVKWKLDAFYNWVPAGISLCSINDLIHAYTPWVPQEDWIERGNHRPGGEFGKREYEIYTALKASQAKAREKSGPGRALNHDPNWAPVYHMWYLDEVPKAKGELFVYLLVAKGRYKIGITSNLKKRLKKLMPSFPDRDTWYEYYRATPLAVDIERYIKAKFDLLYEWFDSDVDVDSVISIMVNYKPEWGVGPSDEERHLKARRAEYHEQLEQQRIKAVQAMESVDSDESVDPEESISDDPIVIPPPTRKYHPLAGQNWATLDHQLHGLGMKIVWEDREYYLVVKHHKPGTEPYTAYDETRQPKVYRFGDDEAFRLADLIAKQCLHYRPGCDPEPFRWDMSKFWDSVLALCDPTLRPDPRYTAFPEPLPQESAILTRL